jgi:hypothetical protein
MKPIPLVHPIVLIWTLFLNFRPVGCDPKVLPLPESSLQAIKAMQKFFSEPNQIQTIGLLRIPFTGFMVINIIELMV